MRSVGRKLHQNKFTSAAVKVVEAGQGHPQVDLERSWSKAKWVFGKTLANFQHNLRKNCVHKGKGIDWLCLERLQNCETNRLIPSVVESDHLRDPPSSPIALELIITQKIPLFRNIKKLKHQANAI